MRRYLTLRLLQSLVLLLLVFVAAGSVFGGVEIVTVAYTEERGVPAAAAWVLAGYAVGSLLAGLAYGALDGSGPPGRRFFVAALGFAAGMVPLALVEGVVGLAVVLLVPEGIGRLFEVIAERLRPRRIDSVPVSPDLARLSRALGAKR